MATEELIVVLDAKTKALDAKLISTNEKLERLEDATRKNDSSFSKLTMTAKSVASSVAKVATVAIAVGSAITAMTLASANNRRELELLARQAKTTAEDFQALSFATKTYGINAEQIADISKDISDKVGEFSAAGTGAFQDYADVMKLTAAEARQVAIDFEGLSSQQVIGEMIKQMESAGVTGDKMTFVMESMGNDLSKLIPLFSKNSQELNTLKARFNDINSSMAITAEQSKELEKVAQSFDLMTTSMGNASTAISATLAPVVDDFFNDIIEVVPDATQTIVDFINTFLSAENITTRTGVLKEISASQARLVELEERLASAKRQTNKGGSRLVDTSEITIAATENLIKKEKERTSELNAQLEALKQQEQAIEDARKHKGGKIGGENCEAVDTGLGTGDQLQAIADRFKDEETLLTEKLDRELKIVGDNNELRRQLHDEYLMSIVEMDLKADEERAKIETDAIDRTAKLKSKAAKAEMKLEESVAKNAISLTKMVLGDNKAAALLGLAIQKASALSANATATASGAMLAYASQIIPGDPTSIARAELARDYTLGLGATNAGLIIATGLGEAAGIMSGGGGGSFSGGGSSEGAATTPAQQDFQPETSAFDIDDATESGTQMININVPDGDEIGEAIANWLNNAQKNGRT